MPVALTQPMHLLATTTLPEGSEWSYELELDRYRRSGRSAGTLIMAGGVYRRQVNGTHADIPRRDRRPGLSPFLCLSC
jgi:hypothetical protein